jgi:hypothetical protein
MTTRREFLSTGLKATGVVALATLAGGHAGFNLKAGTIPTLFVRDLRCDADVVAKFVPHKVGYTACPVEGDVTSAWFGVLRPHMMRSREAIAGLTQGDALFCLKHLAADLGWKVERCHDHAGNSAIACTEVGCSAQVYSWLLVPPQIA